MIGVFHGIIGTVSHPLAPSASFSRPSDPSNFFHASHFLSNLLRSLGWKLGREILVVGRRHCLIGKHTIKYNEAY